MTRREKFEAWIRRMEQRASDFERQQPRRRLSKRRGVEQPTFGAEELDAIASRFTTAAEVQLRPWISNAVEVPFDPEDYEPVDDSDEPFILKSVEHHLLSWMLYTTHTMILLLAKAAVAARVAHRITGVPASLLLAECWSIGASFFGHGRNDFFDTGKSFPSAESSFLARAMVLGKDRRFQRVIRAAGKPLDAKAARFVAAFGYPVCDCQYLKELELCEVWDKKTREGIAATIVNFGLQECDLLPPEAPGGSR